MLLVPISNAPVQPVSANDTSEVVAQVIDATISLYARRGYVEPWIGYLGVEDGRVVGSCGFAGPLVDGEAEIAYFAFPGCEGRGVATRMATELLRSCREAADLAGGRFIAHTLPEEGPSTTILRKLGFRNVGAIDHSEDGVVWKWVESGRQDGD